ncbi:MAG: hypothetical protein WD000_07040 [Thermodesulfobacteriota bacterium]
MSESVVKQERISEVSLEELLRDKSSESLTPLEVSSARINLLNFFETLVEIAKENPEIIQENPHFNNQELEMNTKEDND